MTDKFFSAMGLSRKAGKLSIGHDDVKAQLKSGKSKLLIYTSDVSERLKKEFSNLAPSAEAVITDCTMDDMRTYVGKGAGVFSVTDDGLKKLILSTITKEDSIYGTGNE